MRAEPGGRRGGEVGHALRRFVHDGQLPRFVVADDEPVGDAIVGEPGRCERERGEAEGLRARRRAPAGADAAPPGSGSKPPGGPLAPRRPRGAAGADAAAASVGRSAGDTARSDGTGGAFADSTRFSNSSQPLSARTRRKSSLVAASVTTPISSRRSSITRASSGRPLRLCARASIRMRSAFLGGPFRIACQARS